MRFTQFLAETVEFPEQTVGALKRVETECKPFLKDLGSRTNVLWRGFKRIDLDYTHKVTVPKNRKPLDTELALHHAMDDWFFDNFGHRYRSNAVFASGSESHSKVYGDLYAIYPIGDYEFVWSPKIKDTLLLDEHARKILVSVENKSGMKFKRDEWEEEKTAIIIDVMDKGRYTDKNLRSALASEHEIMVHCDKYYAFSKNDNVWRKWAKYKETK